MYSKNNSSTQQGFVSILTVLLFSVLISVLSVGFIRIMMDEQAQTLEDDLSKSAYNSGLSGIEDAKRAMLHCASLDSFARPNCDLELYNQSCPGFNAGNAFVGLGIPKSSNFKTTIGDPDGSQGYSCVIVKPNASSIVGPLDEYSEKGSNMYSLSVVDGSGLSAVLGKLTIEWSLVGTDDDGPAVLTQGDHAQSKNKRNTGWGDGPALMKASFIEYPGGVNMNPVTASMKSVFLTPVKNSGVGSMSYGALLPSYPVSCPSIPTGSYRCKVTINFGASPPQYIILKTMYNNTNFKITAESSGGYAVGFSDLADIDSTGYTSEVYRRVKAQVRLGAKPMLFDTIDVGEGICKDFDIGSRLDVFKNRCPE